MGAAAGEIHHQITFTSGNMKYVQLRHCLRDIGFCQKEVRKPHHSELLFLNVRLANSRKLKFVSRRKTKGENFCFCTKLKKDGDLFFSNTLCYASEEACGP